MSRILVGVLMSLLGAGGVAPLAFLIYSPSEAHAHRLLSIGMPGVILIGLISLVALLGGLGLVVLRRPDGL